MMNKNCKRSCALFFCFIIASFPAVFAQEASEPPAEKIAEEIREDIFDVIVSDKTEDEICEIIQKNKYSKKELNKTDENGYSPIYLAIDTKKPKVLSVLLQNGADKNQIANLKIRDKSGRKILRCSPVLYASWKGNADCLKILLEKKAKSKIESDFIIPTSRNTTYIRLAEPIDAAFYNRRNIDFQQILKTLGKENIDFQHEHFTGPKWAYSRVKTYDLLKDLVKN